MSAEQLLWSRVFLKRLGLSLSAYKSASGIISMSSVRWIIKLNWFIFHRNENHPVYKYCWFGVLWVDTWKKTLIYSILAVLIVVQPHREWFSIVAAMTLIALGLLHFARWYSSLYKVQPSLLESQSNDIEGFVWFL